MTMNIELFTLASEETLISITVFSAAFFFFLYQRISILKRKIAIYEESDATSEQTWKREMNKINEIFDDLKYEYAKVKDSVYDELTSLEMGNLGLKPKMADFQKTMAKYSKTMQKTLDTIEISLSSIHKKSSDCETQELSTPLTMLNDNLTAALSNLNKVAESCVAQSNMINELSNDFALIKKGHGLE